MDITYKTNVAPVTGDIVELYISAGLRRPVDDAVRITEMYANSNLVVSAWDDNRLVGVARSLTDFCYCCYLSDLAVHNDYKQQGIGKQLIALTRETLGEQVTLILLSAPGAMDYYPKVGFIKEDRSFIIHRAK